MEVCEWAGSIVDTEDEKVKKGKGRRLRRLSTTATSMTIENDTQ